METLQQLFIEPDAVITDLKASTGEEAIEALHAAIRQSPAVEDPGLLLKDLRARYRLSSVCPAADVAVPHARTAALNRIVLAVGLASGPVAFDSEHPAVRIVFLVGTPRPLVTEYLAIVSLISRVWRHAPSRAALLAAKNESELRTALARGVEAATG